jgi:hypothetical protein
MALSIMTLRIMALSIRTLSIMTLSKMALSIRTLRIRTRSIMTLRIMTHSIMALCVLCGKPFQPSLMFVGEARSLPQSGAPENCFTQVGSSLICKL